MKLKGDRIREETELVRLLGIQRRLLTANEAESVQKELEIQGKRKAQADALRGEAAGIASDIRKVADKLHQSQREAREGIEGALRTPQDAAAIAARTGVERAYLTEREKLEKLINEEKAKGTETDLRRVSMLDEEIAKLPAKLKIEQDIAATEAVANVNRQREFTYGWEQAFRAYSDSATNNAKIAQEAFSAVTSNLEKLIDNFSKTGKLSFKTFTDAILSSFSQIAAKTNVNTLLQFATDQAAGAVKPGGLVEQFGQRFGSLFGGGTQAPAPFETRSLDAALNTAQGAAKATEGASFSAAVAAASTGFSSAVTTSAAAFTPEITSAGTSFAAQVAAAGSEFAAAVAASTSGGMSGIGGLLGGTSAAAPAPALLSVLSEVHTGGVIGGDILVSRPRDMSVFSGAPRFHTGGLVGSEVPIIALKGEGVFTPQQMRAMQLTSESDRNLFRPGQLNAMNPSTLSGPSVTRISASMPAHASSVLSGPVFQMRSAQSPNLGASNILGGARRFHAGGIVGDEDPIIVKHAGVYTPQQAQAAAPVPSNANNDKPITPVIVHMNINTKDAQSFSKSRDQIGAQMHNVLLHAARNT